MNSINNIESGIRVSNIPEGWWMHVSPLARIEPTEWVLGVIKKGKKSWITEVCESGFNTPQEAYDWGMRFIMKKESPNG